MASTYGDHGPTYGDWGVLYGSQGGDVVNAPIAWRNFDGAITATSVDEGSAS